jgi:DNA-binding transcriptional LysR family regulator
LEALKSGEIEGAFVGVAPNKLPQNISMITWKKEPLQLVIPEDHRLASNSTLALAELKDEDWVMISRTAAPAFRRQFDHICQKARIKPRVVQESDRAAAILTMVAAGQGVSLLPESVSPIIRVGVVFITIRDAEATLAQTFAFRNSEPGSPIAGFLDLLSSPTIKNQRTSRTGLAPQQQTRSKARH